MRRCQTGDMTADPVPQRRRGRRPAHHPGGRRDRPRRRAGGRARRDRLPPGPAQPGRRPRWAGASAWSFVLQPAGKVDAWLRLVRTADDEVVLDVDGGHGEALVARLRRFLLRTKADVDPLDWQGRWPCVAPVPRRRPRRPAGRAIGRAAVPGGLAGRRGRRPARTARGAAPAVAAAVAAALRVAAHPQPACRRMGAELTEATIPAEVGPVGHRRLGQLHQGLLHRPGAGGPHRQPGRQRAPAPARASSCPGDAPPTAGTRSCVDGAEVGAVTSVAPGPGGGAVALAIVRPGGRAAGSAPSRWPAAPWRPPSSTCRSRAERARRWGSGPTTRCWASRSAPPPTRCAPRTGGRPATTTPTPGATPGRMTDLNAAWHVLGDPGRRAAYDRDAGPATGTAAAAPRRRRRPRAPTWAGVGHRPRRSTARPRSGPSSSTTEPLRPTRALDGWWALLPPATLVAAVGAFFARVRLPGARGCWPCPAGCSCWRSACSCWRPLRAMSREDARSRRPD